MFYKIVFSVCIAFSFFANATAQDQTEEVVLNVGDDAPDWELTGSDDKVYRLSDYKDKQGVVVAWYPMALTGG